MTETTVSSKFQVVIPKPVRERAGIVGGQRLRVLVRGRTVLLVPAVPLSELRGFAPGLDAEGLREKVDRACE